MGNKKKNVSKLVFALVLLIGACSVFVGCNQKPEQKFIKYTYEYIKKDITVELTNTTGEDLFVSIKYITSTGPIKVDTSSSDSSIVYDDSNYKKSFKYSDLKLKKIEKGKKESFIIKDVVYEGISTPKSSSNDLYSKSFSICLYDKEKIGNIKRIDDKDSSIRSGDNRTLVKGKIVKNSSNKFKIELDK